MSFQQKYAVNCPPTYTLPPTKLISEFTRIVNYDSYLEGN